ncbi:hypothetical protein [Deinococcus humi]|uniref:Uncharacterized protein n=1 Tax=Deinococcus humi TaxID=662880 RepID=A0A7W8JYU9_9DEIO|nr:hypothetical protein [Deinococcus humi]MBB5364209.1 hypothetical protein [Deinococcus humi]GGO38516.1 hypothetical protein GCM10008949_45190 [Deinococcus humi]
MRPLIIGALALACQAQAQVQRFQTERGVLTTFQTAVALTDQRGRLLWRRSLPVAEINDVLLVTDRALLNITVLDHFSLAGGIMSLNLKTGQTLWAALSMNTEAPNVDTRAKDVRRGWGVVGDTVWWSHTATGGAYLAQGTTALDIATGQIRDEVSGVPLARRGPSFLLLADSPGDGDLNGTALDVLLWDSASMKIQPKTFTVPPRPGCGSLIDDFPGYANQADG